MTRPRFPYNSDSDSSEFIRDEEAYYADQEVRSDAQRTEHAYAEMLLENCPLLLPNSRFKYLIRHGVEQGVAVKICKPQSRTRKFCNKEP